MFTSPTVTNPRSYAADLFNRRLSSGRRRAFLARLRGKSTTLPVFTNPIENDSLNRKRLGIVDILVEQVSGTLDRGLDFDTQFRPLRKNLRERWVNMYLYMTSHDIPPIVVYKLGEQYYVEDGHHRLSVARSLGVRYIQAEVWEYARKEEPPALSCPYPSCPLQLAPALPAACD